MRSFFVQKNKHEVEVVTNSSDIIKAHAPAAEVELEDEVFLCHDPPICLSLHDSSLTDHLTP